jgi:hypothetical protein
MKNNLVHRGERAFAHHLYDLELLDGHGRRGGGEEGRRGGGEEGGQGGLRRTRTGPPTDTVAACSPSSDT